MLRFWRQCLIVETDSRGLLGEMSEPDLLSCYGVSLYNTLAPQLDRTCLYLSQRVPA